MREFCWLRPSMVDTLSPAERSKRMGLVKSKATKPEMKLRRIVSSMGYRYRLNVTKLPGKPDLTFHSKNKVIFLHGCFWHRHEGCKNARWPKSKLDFWVPKLEANAVRDKATLLELKRLGWSSLVIWECELVSTERVEKRVKKFLG